MYDQFMSRTYTNLLTHVVFSTKDREPLIRADMKDELYAYLGGLTKELKGKAYGINGIDDHVHMLVNLPPLFRCQMRCGLLSQIHQRGFTNDGQDCSTGSPVMVRLA
jgi:REP element-mobilizing transposase RayT